MDYNKDCSKKKITSREFQQNGMAKDLKSGPLEGAKSGTGSYNYKDMEDYGTSSKPKLASFGSKDFTKDYHMNSAKK